jgi:hypothetical protein
MSSEAEGKKYVPCDVCGAILPEEEVETLEVLVDGESAFFHVCPRCWRREGRPSKYIQKWFKSGPYRDVGVVPVQKVSQILDEIQEIIEKSQKISLKGKDVEDVEEIRESIISKLIKAIELTERLIKEDPEKYLRLLGYLAQVLNSACDSKVKVGTFSERIRRLEEFAREIEKGSAV